MKGIAKHSAEYINDIGLKRWHTLELEFDQSTKHPLDALAEVEALVQQAVSKSNSQVVFNNSNLAWGPPVIPNGTPTIIQVNTDEKETGVTPELILASKDLTELESFRWHLKKNSELERAYILRYDQLTTLTTTNNNG